MRAVRRILVGSDFSRPATRAVARAAMLAAELGATLSIVHVAPRSERAALRRLGIGREAVDAPGQPVRQGLERALALARSHQASASARIVTGATLASLREEATRLAVDLVVLGCRGQHTLRDRFLGTTAERLMESWPGDLLLVKSAPRARYRTTLACLALAPASSAVLQAALAWAEGTRLHLLHAYEIPLERKLLGRGIATDLIRDYRRGERQSAALAMAALGERHLPSGAPRPAVHLRRGYAPRVILSTITRLRPDLVVIGRHQSPARERYLGSTAKHVVREALADVLLAGPR